MRVWTRMTTTLRRSLHELILCVLVTPGLDLKRNTGQSRKARKALSAASYNIFGETDCAHDMFTQEIR